MLKSTRFTIFILFIVVRADISQLSILKFNEFESTYISMATTPIIVWDSDIRLLIDEEKELKSILIDDYEYIENLKDDVKIEKKTNDGYINVEYAGNGILCFSEAGEYICTVKIKGKNAKIVKINIIVNRKSQYIKYLVWGISVIGILCVTYLIIKNPNDKYMKK